MGNNEATNAMEIFGYKESKDYVGILQSIEEGVNYKTVESALFLIMEHAEKIIHIEPKKYTWIGSVFNGVELLNKAKKKDFNNLLDDKDENEFLDAMYKKVLDKLSLDNGHDNMAKFDKTRPKEFTVENMKNKEEIKKYLIFRIDKRYKDYDNFVAAIKAK